MTNKNPPGVRLSNVKSNLTGQSFQASAGRPMKVFDVPDESAKVQQEEPLYDYSQDQGDMSHLADADLDAINAHLRSRNLPAIGEVRRAGQPISSHGQQANPVRKPAPKSSFEYPDEAGEVRQLAMQARQARKEKIAKQNRLSDGAKKRIEMLCGMFSATKEVDIDGQTFVLRTLKGVELKEALVATAEFAGSVSLAFESRKQFLARSILSVAGNDVDAFLGVSANDADDFLEAKLEFIEELPEPIISRLYAEYSALDSESQEKYGMKTAEDVKQTAEDIKK